MVIITIIKELCSVRWHVNRVVFKQHPYEIQDYYIFGLRTIEVQADKVNDTFFHIIFISSEMKLLLHAYLKITCFVKNGNLANDRRERA